MKLKQLRISLLLAIPIFFVACDNDNDTVPDNNLIIANTSVAATGPANNSENVALNKVISAGFDEAMDPSTINNSTFTLMQGETSIEGTVAYNQMTATFDPDEALISNSIYKATISTGVKNISGNAIHAATVWYFKTGSNEEGMAKVDLGSSANYVILAKTAINNGPTSAITGDIGISPAAATFITGFSLVDDTGYATSSQITGKAYAADMAVPTPSLLTTAVEDMILAYNNAAGRSNPDYIELSTGDIGSKTLISGLYKWSNTVRAQTDVVLSGSANEVWIFQIAGDLTIGSGVNIILSGGAKAENIFWQVAGEVTLGTTADFKGVILSMTGITLQTNAVLTGRALAQTAVILDSNTVTRP